METLKENKYRGYTVKIRYDQVFGQENLIENLIVGSFYNNHRGYKLDKYDYAIDWLEDRLEELKEERKSCILLGAGLYEHSGVRVYSTGGYAGKPSDGAKFGNVYEEFRQSGWDRGLFGAMLLTVEDAKKTLENLGQKYKNLNQAYEVVENYWDGYLRDLTYIWNGEVYGYTIHKDSEDSDKVIDSCWGFYGDEWEDCLMSCARDTIDAEIKEKYPLIPENQLMELVA